MKLLGQLIFSIVPTEDILQIQMAAEAVLVAIAGGAVVAAVQVAAHFAGVIDFEIAAFFRRFGARAVPVSERTRWTKRLRRGRTSIGRG